MNRLTTETSIYEYARHGLDLHAKRTAIWFYGKRIRYDELFGMIDNVAEHLYGLGVREGTVVTVFLPNCPQAVMAVYAVAKLGGICSMVHPLFPVSVLQEMMLGTDSSFLICSDLLKGDFPPAAVQIVFASLNAFMGPAYKLAYTMKNHPGRPEGTIPFEGLTARGAECAAVFPEPASLGGKCVFFLHSSGTAGEPKTVMHSHRAVNSWEADADAYYGHPDQAGRSIYCVLPFFHGFGLVTGMHHAMVNKMEQIIVPRFSAAETVRLLHRKMVSVIIGTPALYEKLMAEKRFTGSYLPYLNECTVGGDRAGETLFEQFDRRLDPSGKNRFLFEGYGMTEVLSAVSYNNAHVAYRQGTAGKLLPGILARVRRGDKISETGEGEILLSGNTMMLGYLDAEQPFLSFEGRDWLPTGDYGRLDAEGFISCQDRIKDIIIHNGYNVIPGRVELALAESPAVKEVCVTGEDKDRSSTQRIVAWLAAESGADREALREDLTELCRAELAPYEWPGQFRLLEKLPRTLMGKIDRKALRECKWEAL